MEYLDFKQIAVIPFKSVLDFLNIPYNEKNGEMKGHIKGDLFVINVDKNLFFMSEAKGSVINFVSEVKDLDLRSSASLLKKQFLEEYTPKRELPNLKLEYCRYLEKLGITKEIAEQYEVGLSKERGIMAGKIAFKCYDHTGEHTGYVGFNQEKKDWFFPKNFKRPLWNYNLFKDEHSIVLTVNPFDSLYLLSLGLKSISLLGTSMTEEQEELLDFGQILLVHPSPENIVNRLFRKCFIKALDKPLNEYSVEKIF